MKKTTIIAFIGSLLIASGMIGIIYVALNFSVNSFSKNAFAIVLGAITLSTGVTLIRRNVPGKSWK